MQVKKWRDEQRDVQVKIDVQVGDEYEAIQFAKKDDS